MNEIVIFKAPSGQVDVRLEKDNVWLSLPQLSLLFGRDKSVVSRYLRNIFAEGELDRDATVANFATVQDEGGREVQRHQEHYNLDVIISVGYRVKSASPSCLPASCTATAGYSARMTIRSSTTLASPRCRCCWSSPDRARRTC